MSDDLILPAVLVPLLLITLACLIALVLWRKGLLSLPGTFSCCRKKEELEFDDDIFSTTLAGDYPPEAVGSEKDLLRTNSTQSFQTIQAKFSTWATWSKSMARLYFEELGFSTDTNGEPADSGDNAATANGDGKRPPMAFIGPQQTVTDENEEAKVEAETDSR